MFERVKKADWQPEKRNGCDLRRDGKAIQKKSCPLKDDIRVNMKPVMQLKGVCRQGVIQMAPYDDYLKRLQSVTGTDWVVLCDYLRRYIEKRTAYEEERREQDTNRKMELAGLLNTAFEISKKANAIRMGMTNDNAELIDLLTALGKFVHVELSPDETMSLDDLSDILEQTRALVEMQAGGSSESSVEGKDKVREVGLLSVTDSEKQQRLVLMINGGSSLEGTGGSVAAPGESTPVFKDNWRDVRFIAHTHPNEPRFQTDAEFKTDVEAANRESEKRGGLKRAEMVQRDQITGGIDGTIFYTGDGVLSEKRGEQYTEGFAVRADNLQSILDENKKHFTDRLKEEEKAQYEQFEKEFANHIMKRIMLRDRLADALKRETLSAAGFLELEQQLAQLSTDNPEIFDAGRLRTEFAEEYWRRFPRPQVQEDAFDIFSMLEGGMILDAEEEDAG